MKGMDIRVKSLREIFGETVTKLAEKDMNIVVLDCDVARHTKLDIFLKKFPQRFYQIGIAEQNAVGIAAGLAKSGKIPIVASFAIFICGRAWEQIRHSIVINNTNVKIVGTHAGLSAGEDGVSHQCVEDISLMMTLPGIEIFAPAFPRECKKICEYIMTSNKPCYIRMGRSKLEYDIQDNYQVGDLIVKGKLDSDTAVISTGEVTQEVYRVLKKLKSFKAIHIGTIRPLHIDNLKSELLKCKKVIIIEENSQYGGLASLLYVNEVLNNKQVVCLNMKEKLGQTGTESELREYYGFSEKKIEKQLLLLNVQ